MSHFAKVVDNRVVQVIVAEPEFFDTFVDSSPGLWIQTSYNTRGNKHFNPETGLEDDGVPLRKNFAGTGYHYDPTADAFYEPQPYGSWTLNTTSYLWEPPIPHPDDGNYYVWDEEAYKADNSTGWVRND